MVTDVKIEEIPGAVIVTLAQAKKQLRVESSFVDEDDLIQGYIDAAVGNSENYIGGHIVEKNMILKLDAFDNPLVFEAFPIQTIESVKYFPISENEEVELSNTNYNLTSVNPKVSKVTFKTMPQLSDRFDAITVTVKIGIGIGKTPKPIIQAILLQVSDMYDRREDRTEVILSTAMALLRPYKKF